MKFAVCDDIEKDRKELIRMLESLVDSNVVISEFDDERKLEISLENNSFDLVFLDIQMTDENAGIRIKKYIESEHMDTFIIFITAFSAYHKDTHGRNVLWLLEKPIKKEELEQAMDAFFFQKNPGKAVFIDEKNGEVIFSKQVKYINFDNKYAEIYKINGNKILIRKSIKELINELAGEGFLQIRRETIVNMRYIDKIITLENGRKAVKLVDSEEKFVIPKGKIIDITKKYSEFKFNHAIKI